ncbi:hypothetical protein NG895_16590 [Aeoliella sp. ICT_H6.2]|uniref:Glycosyl hydrolases family 43 n=1 Tax=Aeoliella straminimaris TaxID=2954799 RepID=A0A9X2FH21_9BACT|nr:hypothetical protein [Aeoliella straminimaris]
MRYLPATIVFILAALLSSASATAEQVLLITYFDSNGENGVFLAASRDGRTFYKLNDGKPIFRPPRWKGQSLTRDPSVVWHDGLFHMVWTSNWNGNVLGYANSQDMVEWSEPQMIQPFPEGQEQPNNIWAPELFHDPVADDFKIAWASTLPSELNDDDGSADRHGGDHRMYYLSTKDFQTFSKPELLVEDQNYSMIDGFMVYDEPNERWVTSVKSEVSPERGGKNLRLAFSPPKISPRSFKKVSGPIVGPGSPVRSDSWAEGASLVRWHGKWLLYWDCYTKHHYGLAESDDLESWRDQTDQLEFPVQHPRHGTVFVADTEQLGWELPAE